jgi:signal transduction histidine kinase
MSERMIHRIDLINAYGRWLALIPIPLLILFASPGEIGRNLTPVWIATGIMAVLDLIPIVMLRFKYFPEAAAWIFAILDSLFSLALLFLAGPSMFFYCFVPAIAMSVRFDWAVGLVDAALLVGSHILITLIRTSFANIGAAMVSSICQALALMLVSALSGLLAENIKKEPPLNAQEVKAREKELKQLQAAADRSRAIYEMAGTLSATLNPDKILDAVLEISAVGFDELDQEGTRFRERPASAVFLFGTDGLYVAASRSINYEELEFTVSGKKGILGKVLSSGEPALLGNLADDPELRRFSAFRRCRSAICVPLRAGFEIYGAILFASPQPETFGHEHIELLNAVSNQAAVALTNAHLFQDLQEEKERIIAVQEEARTKLARDLHDGPTQSISAIAMRLNFVRLLLGRDPQKVKDELFKLENLARRTTKEIRTMLFTLRPVVLETQGLKAAVEQLAEKFKETDDTPITIEIDDLAGQLDVSTQAVAWFITQESLNNARKYAKAHNIYVRMYIRDGYFVAEIEDDGEGFDVGATMASYDQRGSFGLLNLQERAELVNGRTTIESAPGKGTKITLVVPLSREVT